MNNYNNNRYAPKRFNNYNGYNPRPGGPGLKSPHDWRKVEIKVRGSTQVEINEKPLRVPQFSFNTATARFDENGHVLETSPHISVYAIPDLIKTLQEVYDKYVPLRENAMKERDAEVRRFQGDEEVDYEADLEDREAPVAAPRRR